MAKTMGHVHQGTNGSTYGFNLLQHFHFSTNKYFQKNAINCSWQALKM